MRVIILSHMYDQRNECDVICLRGPAETELLTNRFLKTFSFSFLKPSILGEQYVRQYTKNKSKTLFFSPWAVFKCKRIELKSTKFRTQKQLYTVLKFVAKGGSILVPFCFGIQAEILVGVFPSVSYACPNFWSFRATFQYQPRLVVYLFKYIKCFVVVAHEMFLSDMDSSCHWNSVVLYKSSCVRSPNLTNRCTNLLHFARKIREMVLNTNGRAIWKVPSFTWLFSGLISMKRRRTVSMNNFRFWSILTIGSSDAATHAFARVSFSSPSQTIPRPIAGPLPSALTGNHNIASTFL